MERDFIKELASKKRVLLGLPIHDFTRTELLSFIEKIIDNKDKAIVYGFSGGIYPRIKEMPEFINFFNEMDIIVSDGAGTPLLSKLFNVRLRQRIGIPYLSRQLLELANRKKYNVALFGATKEINNLACERVRSEYPQISQCFGINGYFSSKDEMDIVEKLNDNNPQIILIGISSPIKERFALKYKHLLNANIIMPCGGVIDVLAGQIKRPPSWIERLPLTWLYRFFQEPKRLFTTTIKLVLQLLVQLLPVLYVKHLLGIEKNPSIIKHYKINPHINIAYKNINIKNG